MKKMSLILIICSITFIVSNVQTAKAVKVETNVKSENHLSSSILLWMRSDKPRQAGMDRWKGPHAQIIAANKGLWEYRQIHFAENNPGLWQPIMEVETTIPSNRKIDGVADVTLKNIFSIFRGKKQTKLAFADEVNLFKRTILYAAFPKNSRWYKVTDSNANAESSVMVFFRKKENVSDREFTQFINDYVTPTLANSQRLMELRSKIYNPWKQKQWDTPNVEHDNDISVQFQASLILGFSSKAEMESFFNSDAIKDLSGRISSYCSAVHAYEISEIITFVNEGKQLTN